MKTTMFILLLCSVIVGQVNVSIDVNLGNQKQEEVVVVPQGYVMECEDREDLIVISPDLIGFWVRLPSGRFVLHCRSVWYNSKTDILYYGPWREDRHMIYRGKYTRYDDNYVYGHYPKYKGHHRQNMHEREKYIHEHEKNDRRDHKRHER